MFLTYPLDADYCPNLGQMFRFWLFSLTFGLFANDRFRFQIKVVTFSVKLLLVIALDSGAAFSLKKALDLSSFFRPLFALACKYIENSGIKFAHKEKTFKLFLKNTRIFTYSDLVQHRRYHYFV